MAIEESVRKQQTFDFNGNRLNLVSEALFIACFVLMFFVASGIAGLTQRHKGNAH